MFGEGRIRHQHINNTVLLSLHTNASTHLNTLRHQHINNTANMSRLATSNTSPAPINGQWTLPNPAGLGSTVVTIRNSQFVPSQCHGAHWNHCRYFVDSLFESRGRPALKVVGGDGSRWRRRFHQRWYLQENGQMNVVNDGKKHVCHKWAPYVPTDGDSLL